MRPVQDTANDAGWNEEAKAPSTRGHTDRIKDELASRDRPTDFQTLVSLAIRVDNRINERHCKGSRRDLTLQSPELPTENPSIHLPLSFPGPSAELMQLGHTHLSLAK